MRQNQHPATQPGVRPGHGAGQAKEVMTTKRESQTAAQAMQLGIGGGGSTRAKTGLPQRRVVHGSVASTLEALCRLGDPAYSPPQQQQQQQQQQHGLAVKLGHSALTATATLGLRLEGGNARATRRQASVNREPPFVCICRKVKNQQLITA